MGFAHALRAEETFTLMAIQIVTGRRHQIRLHTSHIGHPTVCDGKYAARDMLRSDSSWCPRNFLHRYRLTFRDREGTLREALAPLPHDLTKALGELSGCDAASKEALEAWLGAAALRSWDDHIALREK